MDEKVLLKEITTFDRSYEPSIDIYDHLPYSRDISYCTYTPRVFSTGNIIKFYQYQLGKPQIIQTPDTVFDIPDYRLVKEEPEPSGVTEEDDTNTSESSSVDALFTDVSNTGSEQTPAEETASEQHSENLYVEDKYIVPPLRDLE